MKYAPIIVVCLAIGFFVARFFSKEDDLAQTAENLKQSLKIAEAEADSIDKASQERSAKFLAEINKLSSMIVRLQREIVFDDAEIDNNIAEDSSRAIVEYRQSLVMVDELPDKTDYPTLREIGLGAKYIRQIPKMELIINIQDSSLQAYTQEYDLLRQDLASIKKAQKEVVRLKDLTIEYKDKQIKAFNSFWDDRIIVYGGIGMSYSANNQIQPTLQLGIGVKIITLYKGNQFRIFE